MTKLKNRVAGIYCRISEDRTGAGLGVARQEGDCRTLCDSKGWSIAETYVDNDVSAYSGAPRPAWQRLVADAAAGRITAIVVWHIDRLTRSPRELEDVIDLADRLGLSLATVTGEVDLGNPTGRMVARMLGAAARHEAEHKAERQRAEHIQRAQAGKVAGGGWRPYGFLADRVTINEPEAAIIREAAARSMTGESLGAIVRDFATRGIVTSQGNAFKSNTLKTLLCSARISGRREHRPNDTWKGKGARPMTGEIIATAVWPAIISPEHSDMLRAALTRPERRTNVAVGRSYLLSGILRCGECGGRMVGRPRDHAPRYVCPNVPGSTSCGKLATSTPPTDRHIVSMALTALATPELAERLRRRTGTDPDLIDRIRRTEDDMVQLATDKAEDLITRAEWLAQRQVLAARLTRDRNTLARTTRTTILDGFTGTLADLERRFADLPIGQQRALIGAVVEQVTVNRTGLPGQFDPDRFVVRWRA